MILRARLVLPIVQPPIDNGAVVISGERIKEVGRWRDLSRGRSEPKLDLGEVILMPGLLNAHCHLDYTHMAGQLSAPRRFIDWLKLITTTKAQWTTEEYRASWLSGAQMLLRTGTTTVADIEAVPELLPEAWEATPLRVISFLEMIGITERRLPDAVLQEALDRIATLTHPRSSVGLSPHAPYSTVPRLIQRSAEVASRKGWLISTHVAESEAEFAMFAQGRGDMFDWLQRSGRDMSDCGSGSPVRYLQRCGALNKNLVAIHLNYLARGDAALLAQNRVNVVHCPRSHAYFGHEPFPMRRLLRAGVNVCLGTDSLASVIKTRRQPDELDMLAEMRSMADRHPWLSPRTLLRLSTLNSARALDRSGRLGQLSPGAMADLIALRASAKPSRIFDAVLQHRGPVAASMIGGQWALVPS